LDKTRKVLNVGRINYPSKSTGDHMKENGRSDSPGSPGISTSIISEFSTQYPYGYITGKSGEHEGFKEVYPIRGTQE
jgi:hypothetical protein